MCTINYINNVLIEFLDPNIIDIDTLFHIFAYLVPMILHTLIQFGGHFVMQIRPSKTHNLAWEPGLSDSAYLNYAKKSGSQLLPNNAARTLYRALFQNSH